MNVDVKSDAVEVPEVDEVDVEESEDAGMMFVNTVATLLLDPTSVELPATLVASAVDIPSAVDAVVATWSVVV